MCAIDDAERFSIWVEDQRRAAKEHSCSECGRQIAKGETYLYTKGLMSGYGWSVAKLCAHCKVGAAWLSKECGGYLQHGVREDIREHAEEYRSAFLWRLVVGADRGWERFDKTGLMKIPTSPPLSATTLPTE